MRALLFTLLLLGGAVARGDTLSAAGPASLPPAFGNSVSEPVFLPVDQAYKLAVEVEADGALRLYWQITPGYYLYQHRFEFTLTSASETAQLDVELPPALARSDEFFGDVSVYYNEADITLRPEKAAAEGQLTVVSQGCADAGLCYPPRTQTFSVNFADASVMEMASGPASGSASRARDTPATPATLLYMLVLAFIGGGILNLMPCVFPILSLKVLSFTRGDAHSSHQQGWLYAAGVIVSFLLVAGLLIVLQQAGRAIGWGFQLQTPGFVIALAYLFVAMGLSLSGLVQLGGNLMNVGSGLAGRQGAAGSFFTGVLAVLVASPCTAPFMGTALGFALTQSPPLALLVFGALGAGMAAPLLLLSYSSLARRLLPRPGPWMERLKQVLAFPLYATAIWLLWVAGRQTGVDTMAVALLGMLLIALGLWLWSTGGWRRGVALLALLGAVASGGWRGDTAGAQTGLRAGTVAWSPAAVSSARARGNAVFVDFTADWCITCIANERAVLHTDAMSAAFRERGVVYMVADWTNYDPEIARFLNRMGRSGIPLYLLYSPDRTAEPLVLPQLLRRRDVLAALQSLPEARVVAITP